MKYYNIKRIDNDQLDLKQLFNQYCKTDDHYINHLKNNTSYFGEKLDRLNLDDQKEIDQAIKKFVRDNISRVYLMIWKHYYESNHFDEPYMESIFNHFTIKEKWFYYPDIVFTQESRKVQEEYLSVYTTLIKNFLLDEDILQCDGIYLPAKNELKKGYKHFSYRINPLYYSSDYDWESYRLRVRKSTLESFKDPDPTYTPYKPVHIREIESMMEGWSLNVEAIPDSLKGECQQAIDDYLDQKSRWTLRYSSDYQGQLTTPENCLKKEIRPFLQYEGFEDTEFKNVEMENCHPFLFGAYLLHNCLDVDINSPAEMDKKGLSDKEFQAFDKFANLLSYSDSKDEIIESLSMLLVHVNDEDEFNFDTVYRDLENKVSNIVIYIEQETKDILYRLFEDEEKREYVTFALLASSGLLYDTLSKKFEKKRDDFGSELKEVFNYSNDANYFSSIEKDSIQFFFKNYFPSIWNDLKDLKRNEDDNFSFTFKGMETDIMNDHVSKDLLDEAPFINLHDGIITPVDHTELAKKSIEQATKENYNLTAPVRIENV